MVGGMSSALPHYMPSRSFRSYCNRPGGIGFALPPFIPYAATVIQWGWIMLRAEKTSGIAFALPLIIPPTSPDISYTALPIAPCGLCRWPITCIASIHTNYCTRHVGQGRWHTFRIATKHTAYTIPLHPHSRPLCLMVADVGRRLTCRITCACKIHAKCFSLPSNLSNAFETFDAA